MTEPRIDRKVIIGTLIIAPVDALTEDEVLKKTGLNRVFHALKKPASWPKAK